MAKPKFKTMQDEINYVYAHNQLVAEDLEQYLDGIRKKWAKKK